MEQLKAFIGKTKTDPALAEKMNALTSEGPVANEKVIALAAEYGFTFTGEEIGRYVSVNAGANAGAGKSRVLSEEELEEAAGGIFFRSEDCHFSPRSPMVFSWRGENLWVGCGGVCHMPWVWNTCHCHGTRRCINEMHLMERFPAMGENAYAPAPYLQHNHLASGRVVFPTGKSR